MTKVRLPILGIILTTIIVLPLNALFLWAFIDSLGKVKWYLSIFILSMLLIALSASLFVYVRFVFYYLIINNQQIIYKKLFGQRIIQKEDLNKITIIKNLMYPRLLPDGVSRIIISYNDNGKKRIQKIEEGFYSTRKCIRLLKKYNYKIDYLTEHSRRP